MDLLPVWLSHRGSVSTDRGTRPGALGRVGGAGAVRPLPADVGVRLRHGHTGQHLAVLRLLRPL